MHAACLLLLRSNEYIGSMLDMRTALGQMVTCMACSADKKRVLAVCLEEVLQPCLDLILQMVCIYNMAK